MSKQNKQICKMFDDLTQKLHKKQRNNMLHKKKSNRQHFVYRFEKHTVESRQILVIEYVNKHTKNAEEQLFNQLINRHSKKKTIDSLILISSIIQTVSKVNSFASKLEIRSTN